MSDKIIKLRAIAADAANNPAKSREGQAALNLIQRLAEVFLEEAPTVVLPLADGQVYELVLRVRGRVASVTTGHGLCYELELEPRDYFEGRSVSVDHDEILRATPK